MADGGEARRTRWQVVTVALLFAGYTGYPGFLTREWNRAAFCVIVLQLYLIWGLGSASLVMTASGERLMRPPPLRPVQDLVDNWQAAPQQPHQEPTGLRHRQRDQLRLVGRLFFGGMSASFRTAARTA